MKKCGFSLASFVVTLALLAPPSLYAEGVQSIQKLRQHVLEHTSQHYRGVFGKEEFKNNVEINVGNLDSRLRLAQCDDNLTFKIQEPPRNVRNITVKTSCENQRRWTVYVPVAIDVYADVLVSRHSLEKGQLLSGEDMDYRRVNVASMGYGHIEDDERATGMKLKRPLKAGDVIKLSHLSQPKIVLKGQTVKVRSNSRFLSVETAGIALNSGYMGQSIKVKNEQSNRIVSARVVAPGAVVIATR